MPCTTRIHGNFSVYKHINTYCVPGTILRAEKSKMKSDPVLPSQSLQSSREETRTEIN